MTDLQPPRLARWLLRLTLPPGVRGDTILGDLLEETRARSAHPRRAALWYWRQALSLSSRYGFARLRPGRTHVPPDTSAPPENRPMILESMWHDVRYGVRSYAKTPAFTAAVLTTLALGIGASTAIFSMVDGILLRPLPFQDPDRIAFATEVNPAGDTMSVSWPNFLDWRARQHAFDALALSRGQPFMLTGTDRAARIDGRRVTANFFRLLGVAPALGRGFTDEDDRPNAEPTVMISDTFWKRDLGGDPAVLGRSIVLDAVSHTIVGVLPPGFRYIRASDVFVPMGPIAADRYLLERGNHQGYSAIGRLKPGVTIDAANGDLQAIAAGLTHEHPDTNVGVNAHVEPLLSRAVSDVRLTLFVLLGAVGFLLLIACVNVANLLIARGAARHHELAIRAALGGGRLRLARQLLVESTLVSVLGGALGIALASWFLHLLVAVAPEGTARLDEVRIDGSALTFALAAATLCGIVFGAFPAFQVSNVGGQHMVTRGRSAGASAQSHRLRRGLMVAEVAFALILLTGAGLMVRTLQQLTLVDTGFRPDHLLTMKVALRGPQWDGDRRVPFYDDLVARAAALPGVRSAALVSALPIDGSDWNSIFIAADKPVPPRAQLPSSAFTLVTPRYFDTMGTRLIRGRVFAVSDGPTSTPVVVVNESLARRTWPGEDPIGKRLKQGWPETPGTWREVVGVVADVKFEGLEEATPLQTYLPLSQEHSNDIVVVLHTAGNPESMVASLQAAVQALDKTLPLYSVRTMEQVLDTSMARERMAMLVLILFAGVALTLASVGLYGVVSHGVTERMHEIGVRMALGADARQVVGLVVSQGLTTSAAGTAIGLAGALALTRSIRGLLFGVSGTDPLTFTAVVGMLFAVTLVACYLPARRATRVDPTTALRAE